MRPAPQSFAFSTCMMATRLSSRMRFNSRIGHARLRVRLVGNGLHQLVGQLWHIHQLVHGHFGQGELSDEMCRTSLAARYAIGSNSPICAQRRPNPKRMASSISSVVAMPSLTSHSASRHTASRNRSATKASISARGGGCVLML